MLSKDEQSIQQQQLAEIRRQQAAKYEQQQLEEAAIQAEMLLNELHGVVATQIDANKGMSDSFHATVIEMTGF
jgi:hypothetical protein